MNVEGMGIIKRNRKTLILLTLFLLSFIIFFFFVSFRDLQSYQIDRVDGADNVQLFHGSTVLEQDFTAVSSEIIKMNLHITETSADYHANISYGICRTLDEEFLYLGEQEVKIISDEATLELKFADSFGRGLCIVPGEKYRVVLNISTDDNCTLGFYSNSTIDEKRTYANGIDVNDVLCYEILYNDNIVAQRLYWILAIILAVMVMLCYISVIFLKNGIEKTFLIAVSILGIVMSILLPPGCVEDESSHFMTASAYAGKFEALIMKDVDADAVYIREADLPIVNLLQDYNVSQKASLNYYRTFWSHYELYTADTARIPLETKDYFFVNSTGNLLLYLPSIIGILIAHALNLGTIPLLYLARFFNFGVYIFLCYIGIKKIPFGKLTLTIASLFPVTLQFAASLNYDAVNFGICNVFLGYMIAYIFEREKVSKNDYKILALFTFLLGFTKGGLYIILAGMSLMLICDFRKRGQYADAAKYWIIALAGYFSNMIILQKVFRLTYPLLSESFYTSGASYGGYTCYTITDLLSDPFRVMIMMLRTLFEKGGELLMILFGKYYSWEILKIPDLYVYIMIFVMVMSYFLSFRQIESNVICITKIQKTTCVIVAGVLSFAVMFMMLIAGTQKGDLTVHAIRARYFTPLIPLGIFLAPNWKINNEESLERTLFIVFLCIAMANVLRLFSEIMTNYV